MNQKILTRFADHLPVPSALLRRLSKVLGNPESSASDVADTLRMDPVFSGKVLRLANSAFIGIPRTVSSINHAVVLLGIKRIHSLVITSELLKPVKMTGTLPFDVDRFRRHAVMVACIAESIARHIQRYTSVDEHELFSAALLHDIGKLLAGVVDAEALKVIYEMSVTRKIPFYRAENDQFSHTALGGMLAEKWELPEPLIACVRGHHTAACFPEYHRSVSIIHIADIMAHLLGFSIYPDEIIPALDDAALREVELPIERLRVIADDILKKEEQINSLLGIL